MKLKLPQLPSDLVLSLVQFTGQCPVCNVFVDHTLTPCTDCDKLLCHDNKGGITSVGNPRRDNFICASCIPKRFKAERRVTFVFNKWTQPS